MVVVVTIIGIISLLLFAYLFYAMCKGDDNV